jgi:type I restriction enzyme S subunit
VIFVEFQELFSAPLRNGVSYPAATRGSGIPMVNMGEAFKYDVIANQECERVPLTDTERQRYLLEEGDLLFVRQSLKFEGAGKCVYVSAGTEPRTWESHLMRVRLDPTRATPRYYYYYFQSKLGRQSVEPIIHQVAAAGIRGSDLARLQVPLPPLQNQNGIVSVLTALDDKIAVNDRIATTSRVLGESLFQSAVNSASTKKSIGEISSLLTRGQAPKYTEAEDAVVVLNQKCVRDGRVSLKPARLTEANRVKADRALQKYDVLVNSTGVGTLGRVGIWSDDRSATVDSHVTIIRIASPLPAIIGGFALLAAQPEIEALGEGSTGQTELSRSKLSSLTVQLPADGVEGLASRLTGLEMRADAALNESKTLAALRDTLLPELMSGRLRVKDAEKFVEEAV